MNKRASHRSSRHADAGGDDCLLVADLSSTLANRFRFSPARARLAGLAAEISAASVSKLVFQGTVLAVSAGEWRLSGTLGATVVQQCVVSLKDVQTRIDVAVERRFLVDAGKVYPGIECPVPDDDTVELLAPTIDLCGLAREVLLLELPAYPRAADAAMPDATNAGSEELAEAMDADERPFAILSKIRDRLPE